MDESTDARESVTISPHDDWPWAYEVRRAARLRALSNERITMPLPLALAAAAFVYPFLVLPLYTVSKVADDLIRVGVGLTFNEVASGLVGYPIHAAVIGLFLAVATLVLSSLVWFIAIVITWTLRHPPDETRLALHIAGGTALWGTTVLTLIFFGLYRGDAPVSHFILAMVVGPGLAIPLAQYAGGWSQWPGDGEELRPTTVQFGVFQLLVITAWIALGLALIKWFGLLTPWSLLYLVGWSAYAWVTMRLVIRLCRWRAQRLLNRRGGDGGG